MVLEKKIVENFWKIKLIKLPHDIFELNYDKIVSLEGWGKQSVENLKYSINEKKNINLDRFIYSLGIRHIGLENAKILSNHFKSFSKFRLLAKNHEYEGLLNIDGIGETQINSLKNFFSNKINLVVLDKLGGILKIKDKKIEEKDGLLKNRTFMLTGKLDGISRAEAKSLIEENSGVTVSSITKKLDYLIIGVKPTKRKVENAKEMKIKILEQSQFLKMLNKTS